MTPDDLARHLFECVSAACERMGSPLESFSVADIVIERPKNRDHGDWASSVALKVAKPAGLNPRDLAAAVAEELAQVDGVARADVA